MDQRDAIFRQRLVAVMSALNGGEAKDPTLRRMIGRFAQRLATDARVPDWATLKERADTSTYDALLALFQKQSAEFQAAGDTTGVRALEALALSLIARHQTQPDLRPGIGFLDRYIAECAKIVPAGTKIVVTTRPTAH